MTHEIERKFLVKGDFRKHAKGMRLIVQGYISSHPARSVRVRQVGRQAFLTIKGIGDAAGVRRLEWEQEISMADAEGLLGLCEPGRIEKRRYTIPVGRHLFEVDEFLGDNQGLILAEVELKTEDEAFDKPDWLGEEVTGQERYYNAMLIRIPYKSW